MASVDLATVLFVKDKKQKYFFHLYKISSLLLLYRQNMHLTFEYVNMGLSIIFSVDKNMLLQFCVGKNDEMPGPCEIVVRV